jgi:cellulose synthase/poly-beta-1,6-N-acetylglucosamine synthase-like glycosyltransferase
MTVIAIIFWVCAALLVYTQVGYGLLLALLVRLLGDRNAVAKPGRAPIPASADGSLHTLPATAAAQLPRVSVIVAGYNEQDVIGDRVTNLRSLDYPRELLEIIVACDGAAEAGADATAERAREAGADLVLELPRRGKVLAQDAGVRAAAGEILAFSDANASWEPAALHSLIQPLLDSDRVGYVCGNVGFSAGGGDNQEGVYWRYEMFMRALESRLASITAGNGAIYAVPRDSYMELGAIMSHDIAFPFTIVKRGRRALYVPGARAAEKMAPTIDGEFRRKRRMAARAWSVILKGRMFSPRGYSPLYALMIFSHRCLRYLAPVLHVIALVTSLVLIGQGLIYIIPAAVQLAILLGAWIAPLFGASRPAGRRWPLPVRVIAKLTLICRYYVVTTASLGLGMWDVMRGRQRVIWEPVEGTR